MHVAAGNSCGIVLATLLKMISVTADIKIVSLKKKSTNQYVLARRFLCSSGHIFVRIGNVFAY